MESVEGIRFTRKPPQAAPSSRGTIGVVRTGRPCSQVSRISAKGGRGIIWAAGRGRSLMATSEWGPAVGAGDEGDPFFYFSSGLRNEWLGNFHKDD